MEHQIVEFSDAFSAWEYWNLTGFDSKSEHMMAFKNALATSHPEWSEVVCFHIEQAAGCIGFSRQLIGPTGESNELYCAGRGVTVIIMEAEQENARSAVIAQLTCALVAGNSVVLCSDDHTLVKELERAYQCSSLPMNIIQFAALDTAEKMLQPDVRVVGFVGTLIGEINLNRQLAARSGVIVSLVSETDLATLPMAHDPHLSLRFMTERTRTINITAVGGNATLLGAANG